MPPSGPMSSQIAELMPRPLLSYRPGRPDSGRAGLADGSAGASAWRSMSPGDHRPGRDGLGGGDAGTSYFVLGGLLVPGWVAGQHCM